LVGVALAPSATWQLDTLTRTHSLPGINGDIGLVYQFQHRALLLQTGVNFGITTLRQGVDSMYIGQNILLRNREDDMRALDVNIPLMIGVLIDSKSRENRNIQSFAIDDFSYYATAGLKVTIASNAATSQRGTIAVREEDNRYHEDYIHAFLDKHTVHSKGAMSISPDLRACLEMGTQMRMRRYDKVGGVNPILQIGLFAEYSIVGSHPTSYTDKSTANHADIALQHMYAPYINQKMNFNHLYAGVRVKLLFEIHSDKFNWFD
jgi:hypothetical protein